jgi:hypothetical protein
MNRKNRLKKMPKKQKDLNFVDEELNVHEEKIPEEMIVLPNPDKQFHEKWKGSPQRSLLNYPHPWRMILAAKPNSGKTTMIENVLMRVQSSPKPFLNMYCIHCDPVCTKEYKRFDVSFHQSLPDLQKSLFDEKTLFILEDLDYQRMDPEQMSRLERLMGYYSTHKNISVMLTAQDPFQIPVCLRRYANIFFLWKSHDLNMVRSLASRTGLSKNQLEEMFRTNCTKTHDSLCIDLTPDSPAPYRKNGFEIIHPPNYEGTMTRRHRKRLHEVNDEEKRVIKKGKK